MMTFLGCLLAIIVVAILIIALLCGVVIELFWPILVVVGGYYLIKWLQKETSKKKE